MANPMTPDGRCGFGGPRDVGIERQTGPAVTGKSTRPVVHWSALGAVCTYPRRLVSHPPPGKAQVHGGAPGARRRPIPAPGLRHWIPPRDPTDPVLSRPDRGRSDRPWGLVLRT
ncbi:MAG: hypothetical protein JWR13_3419 [Mycobacterium sp.]|nr:hypothetical protein [Mycobacterium sp.]MDT5314118.1 hypothetical protein [Mycobacterium sp.]